MWNYIEWGGAQVLFFGLMKEARKYGDVIAVLPKESNNQLLNFLNKLGVECDFVSGFTDSKPANSIKRKFERHWNKAKSEYAFVRHLYKLDLSKSIVHAELAPWQSFLALLFLTFRTNVFVTMHNSLYTEQKWRFIIWGVKFRLLLMSKNFHLFTANKNTKESLKKLVSKKSHEKIEVIYANIDPDEIERALEAKLNRNELCERYNLPKNKFYVFCVGQFIDRKGRWVFLKAARKLSEIYDDIAFVWISNYKPDEDDLARVKSFGLEDKFTLIISDQIGSEHIDLFILMRLADIFVLPSFYEGLPISIIEALALGIPTVSTDINAIPEALINNETGLLIEPGNVPELVETVIKLKEDDRLRDKISGNGQKHAFKNFNEKEVAKIALDKYIRAFNNR